MKRNSGALALALAAACGGLSSRSGRGDGDVRAGGGVCERCAGNGGAATTGGAPNGGSGMGAVMGGGSGVGAGSAGRAGGAAGSGGAAGNTDDGGAAGAGGEPDECEPGAVRCMTRRERCTEAGEWSEEAFVCVRHIGASSEYPVACATKSDGQVACWGEDAFVRQVLDVLPEQPWDEVYLGDEIGSYAVCAVDRARTATCWTLSHEPLRVTQGVKMLAVGTSGVCAIANRGGIYCPYVYPDVNVPSDPGPFAFLQIRNQMLIARREDGTLHVPNFLDFPAGTYLDVSLNGDGVCAIDEGGRVLCRPERELPADVANDRFIDIELEYSGAICARRSDDSVRCWGPSDAGDFTPPVGRFTSLAAQSGSMCGIREDGEIACWGRSLHQPPAGW